MLQTELFWVAIAFIVFVAITYRPAKKAISAMLDAHAEQVRASLDEAEKLRADAEQVLASYKKRQSEALKEAEGIIAQARIDSERLRERAAADLEASLKRREAQALDKIAQAEAQALIEVRSIAVDIAIAASTRILTEKLSGPAADKLVDNAIAELPRNLH